MLYVGGFHQVIKVIVVTPYTHTFAVGQPTPPPLENGISTENLDFITTEGGYILTTEG